MLIAVRLRPPAGAEISATGSAMIMICNSRMESAGGPGVALHQDFAVGGHAGFGEADRAFQLDLDPDGLLPAVAAEVGVLRREGRLRVDAQYVSIDGSLRRGIEIDAR